MKDISINDLEAINKLGSISDAYSGNFNFDLLRFHALSAEEAPYMQTQKMHKHQFFELHFVLKGKMLYTANNKLIEAKHGSYLLICPETYHKIESFSADFIKCSLAFSLDENDTMYQYLCIKNGQAERIPQSVLSSLESCIKEAERDTVYSSTVIKNRLFEIIYTISEISERKKKAVSFEGRDIRLIKAKQFIEDNSHIFLGCEDIAAYCYLSVKQLNRIFLKHEGVTLLKYLHNSKIALAERLLKQQGYSIQQISEKLGFSSVYYFSRFFLKHTGFTPASYRKSFS